MFDLHTEDDAACGATEMFVVFERRHETQAAPQAPGDARARCTNCMLGNLCMAASLEAGDMARLDSVVQGWRSVKQGERLYRAGDPFRSLYAVRAGSFKTVVAPERGKEIISGFYMAGDTIGMDGVCQEIHNCDAIALEDSVVCVIPFHLLEALCREIKPLQRQLHKMFSAEIVRESRQMMLLGNLSAEQRVAAFLLSVSARYRERGYSATSFVLRMTREDIGSFLGVTLETVSRALSRFQQEGLLTVQGKSIELLNLDALDAR
ncbi:helix-turn-helix domain-containing protein (plasmid) [Cupriavidus sp. KK10]|jgi:CRP/FNR family transcriptional regulator|uniref:helix-turn-helix domain-containing protein n=1 Tax=Cupriavidus sp. KK10 TaxID=1478019 RepID=UPI001BAE1FCA|nr:helix-turn-helix domain-containing protein [Cupriavidus sp. KK10]QUN32010.1 helix-turn-helix domain-containing protein [Cupriavidus sp. KK10]